jgi:hypothetical protein
LTEIVVILDESGSMLENGKGAEAMSSFKAFVREQAELPGEANITLLLFCETQNYVWFRRHLDTALAKSAADIAYSPSGTTALLDAIGLTVDKIGNILSETPEEQRPGQVIVAIITDGLENSSLIYSKSAIKKMVERQTNVYSWKFNFFGAGIDAYTEASAIGVGAAYTYAVQNSNLGMREAFATYATTVSTARTGS